LKVAVQCVSPLLQRSLELFLKDSISSLKNCDVVVRDKKILDNEHIVLLIGNDESATLQKPFSKSQLFLALENLIDSHKKREEILEIAEEISQEPEKESAELDILEKRIAMLTQDYQDNIMKAIRAFYEK